eukprot:m.416855 g.416855  ORF g.416855 m.416855 type:complete len:207 (-) comp21283_c0_seq14:47-667(-)
MSKLGYSRLLFHVWSSWALLICMGEKNLTRRIRDDFLSDIKDLASVSAINTWFGHPVVGEASFDAFVHSKSNPVYTGKEPDLWPVNGFLYNDDSKNTTTVNQTLYIGLYGSGYSKPTSMLGLSSFDGGATWRSDPKCESDFLMNVFLYCLAVQIHFGGGVKLISENIFNGQEFLRSRDTLLIRMVQLSTMLCTILYACEDTAQQAI